MMSEKEDREQDLRKRFEAVNNVLEGLSNHDALGILSGVMGKIFFGYNNVRAVKMVAPEGFYRCGSVICSEGIRHCETCEKAVYDA